MKVKCTHCDQDLSKDIIKNFEEYEVGRIICPQCKNNTDRYISEADLLLYLSFTIIFYCGALFIIMTSFKYELNIFTLLINVLLFILMYFILKQTCLLVFKNSFFKKTWQNEDVLDEQELVKKRLKKTQIYAIILVIVFGTQGELLSFFPLLMILFLIVLGWRYYNLLKQEKDLLNKDK